MDLNSARFSSSTKTRLYISYNTKADTVYKILCSACLCLLLLVFPLVFAIGGASTKYEKDSATLYRPTIEYGLKVGQPASAKNILIDKKNARRGRFSFVPRRLFVEMLADYLYVATVILTVAPARYVGNFAVKRKPFVERS